MYSGLYRILSRRAHIFSFLSVMLAFLVSSCAPVSPVGITVDRPEINELFDVLDQAGQQFGSVKGFARVTIESGGGRKSASQVVIAQRPDRLRLETLGLFGSPALLAASDGENMVVLLPGEGEAYAGTPGYGFLERMTGLPFTPGDIVTILLLKPQLIVPQSVGLGALADGGSRLRFRNGWLGQEVDFSGDRLLRRVALSRNGHNVSTILYDRYVGGYPHHIEVILAENDIRVVLDFEDVATNEDLASSLFRLEAPSGYKVREIPASSTFMKGQ